ncbi:MAG: DNA gyrase/topoisomerase IV subunit A [Muribaculaceae bacterium]|nr:DNA gyrase/topoisomerase IV subunit A [Muribaculaceae bacterium]
MSKPTDTIEPDESEQPVVPTDAEAAEVPAPEDDDADDDVEPEAEPEAPDTRPYTPPEEVVRTRLRGMYQSWFLEYASYVILERAVPHIDDGLKPVQRRILHAMRTIHDGRFNKVANIVGTTMQYHPHGDASIKDALVQLGQKELLVEPQGNWGNILTGSKAAAARYIEARLSPFALEVLYSPKVTQWTMSYDGRKQEPVTLPAKYPLLLAQGGEGIAVGLSSKILPHNFNEILDAAVAYIRGEEFSLYPDFPTGGLIDVSRYNDGRRGGMLKVRAKIEKIDSKTLNITELPFGKTADSLIESILKAFERGQIKIRKVENNTASEASILVHLQPQTSSDKTIDALYAFTDCEINISPNCCVIRDNKPCFLGISEVLRHSVDTTRDIIRQELNVTLGELREQLMFTSLEKIFIEERIYKDRAYEQASDLDAALAHIDSRLEPFKESLTREVTRDDLLRLLEIKMKRILRFNSDAADKALAALRARIDDTLYRLGHIDEVTIEWYTTLKEKYGEFFPRRTSIRGFASIEAANVAEASEKLYINREEGFVGTGLKKDEFVANCSNLDDIIIFYRDGRYKIMRVQEKAFVGKNVLYVNVYRRKDERTTYNIIYQNGKGGVYYMKRFRATGLARDKEYELVKGLTDVRVAWFTANPNGEAETVKVTLKPKLRLKTLSFDVDFAKLAIKGRGAQGNLVTKNEVARFSLKERGVSTLGGRQVWFDFDVMRLNYEGRGTLLGEFSGDDKILVFLPGGEFYTTGYELTNHYEDKILHICKFDPEQIWTAVLHDADQGYPYLKRFPAEASAKHQRFIGENPHSTLIALSGASEPLFSLEFADGDRAPLEVDAASFIGVKSFKARGKRLTNYGIAAVHEIERPESPAAVEDAIAEAELAEVTEPDDFDTDNGGDDSAEQQSLL